MRARLNQGQAATRRGHGPSPLLPHQRVQPNTTCTVLQPSVHPDPGVTACICDPALIGTAANVCKERLFSEEDTDLHVCLLTRPYYVELVEVSFLAIAQTYKNGRSVYSVLIDANKETPVDKTTSVTTYDNDRRRATILTSIDAKFFKGIPFGETHAKLQGFALIEGAGFARRDADFYVDLRFYALPSAAPSVPPSLSEKPSVVPSLQPTAFLLGLPKNTEVWACQCRIADAKCAPDLLVTQYNNEVSL